MYDIESLYEATSVADACRALADDPAAEVIAGGTDVLVKLREGKGAPAHLVSIHGLSDELDGVRLADDGTVEIGPITWFHHVTTSPVIQATVPTLGEACDTPGGPQLRVSGTIGGNVCTAAPPAPPAAPRPSHRKWHGEKRPKPTPDPRSIVRSKKSFILFTVLCKSYHQLTRAHTPDSMSFRRFLPFSP